MNKKCPRCALNNLSGTKECVRCRTDLREVASGRLPKGSKRSTGNTILRRALVCVAVCVVSAVGLYLSFLLSSNSLSYDEKKQVASAVRLLEKAGFANEVYYLDNFTVFRADDNWLNSLVPKENAFAATNYPFEVITVYPDFFTYTKDDVERAAILLHEARHLMGEDEREAYEFVWRHKSRLGWTKDRYRESVVWLNVRKQTKEYAPGLFVCDFNQYDDCMR